MTRSASIVLCVVLALMALASLPVTVAAQEEGLKLPEAFTGSWEGSVRWEDKDVSITVALYGPVTLESLTPEGAPVVMQGGSISYHWPGGESEDYDCDLELELTEVAVDGKQISLFEVSPFSSDDDPDACLGGGLVILELRTDGSMVFERIDPESSESLRAFLDPVFCDWSGKWNSNWGSMELRETPDLDVTGSYEHDEGRISGMVLGNLLIGTWTEAPTRQAPKDTGAFELTISADCDSFTGTWKYADESALGGDWHGERVG